MSTNLNAMQKKIIERQAQKPKLTGKKCTTCGAPLTCVNAFFGKQTCGACEPIHLLHQEKNTWKDFPDDLPF